MNPFATNPSPLATQRLRPLVKPPALARPLTSPAVNPSPLAAERLALMGTQGQPLMGTQGRPPAPVQLPMQANPAQQALKASLPRGFGSFVKPG